MEIKLLEGPYGIKSAIYGLRLSWFSNEKSDTVGNVIGEEDLSLIRRIMLTDDDSHKKFTRHIVVWLSIKATRDVWQQFATYRIGIEFQSSSTMHLWNKIKYKDILPYHDFDENVDKIIVNMLNEYVLKNEFEKFKKNLPEGYIQERECIVNYQTLRRIYIQRRNHKLKDWVDFIKFIENLPYASDLITFGLEK